MPLLPTTLASGLASMAPVSTEAEGINNFVTAWGDYASGASVAGVPTTPGTLEAALATMRGAMTGSSVSGAAAGLIQAAITAFWGVVCASAVTVWVTVPPVISATPPPGLAGISAALTGVFAANASGNLGLIEGATAVANALHPLQLGGIAIQQAPPAPPISTPIL